MRRLAAILLMLMPSVAGARNFYVSPTGTGTTCGTLDVTISGISYRWRAWPNYRLVVTSDAGTATLNLKYDPCH